MSPSPSHPHFRPDIEGLRAIAVALVVACHAGVPWLSGGFVGVDVFFVISGFLISQLLVAEWQRDGRIDVLAFYARRMRRLLPAFGLLLAFVFTAIWIVYAPIEQPRMLGSALAATLYYSNVHYALEATNYMAPAAKLDPLLHTWSLGVEEQFYLAWPFVLLAAAHLSRANGGRRSPFALILGGLLLASLLGCLYLTGTRTPQAFFMPWSRAWEFAIGALVALYGSGRTGTDVPLPLLRTPAIAGAGALAGLFLIAGAGVIYSATTPFPGWRALLPVLGTTLVILCVPLARPAALASRLLALPPLQWLGRLSYGWYLWHWPLLVIGREVLPWHGLPVELALVALALVLAQLSYTLVEHPLREGQLLRRKAPAFAMAIVLAVTGAATSHLVSARATAIAETPRFQRLRDSMNDVPVLYQYDCDRWFYDASLVECLGGNPEGRHTAVLLGDSHAGQWFTAVDAIMRDLGWKLVVMTKSACPIIDKDFFYPRIGRVFTECGQWKQAAVRRIQALQPDLVIVSNAETYDFAPADWTPGVARLLNPIAAGARRVVILRDSPNPGFSTPSCLARREWNPVLSLRDCSFEASRAQSPAVLSAYQAVAAARPNVSIVDMTPQICAEAPCQVTTANIIKFRDANHLSDTFVRSLTSPLANALLQANAF